MPPHDRSLWFAAATRRVGRWRARRSDDAGRAMLYMVIAALLIPLLNVAAKYLAERYPVLEVVWGRYVGHFAYMVLAFAPRRGLRLMATARPLAQLLRSSCLAVSTAVYVTALRYVPLPTVTAVSFTGPFIVTALSPLLLGERVGARRWLAVAVGFLGALVIVQPGGGAVHPAVFLILASATFSALYQILSRKLAANDSPETSATYTALAGFVLAALPMPWVWQTPENLFDGLIFLSLGVFGGFGHYFMMRAFELAPASFIAPFNYLQLIGAAVLSWLVFAEAPDAMTWIGSAVIASSGIWMLAGERRSAAVAAREERPS